MPCLENLKSIPERKKYTGIEFGRIEGNPAFKVIMRLSNCKQILNKDLLLCLQVYLSIVEVITFFMVGVQNIKSCEITYIFS